MVRSDLTPIMESQEPRPQSWRPAPDPRNALIRSFLEQRDGAAHAPNLRTAGALARALAETDSNLAFLKPGDGALARALAANAKAASTVPTTQPWRGALARALAANAKPLTSTPTIDPAHRKVARAVAANAKALTSVPTGSGALARTLQAAESTAATDLAATIDKAHMVADYEPPELALAPNPEPVSRAVESVAAQLGAALAESERQRREQAERHEEMVALAKAQVALSEATLADAALDRESGKRYRRIGFLIGAVGAVGTVIAAVPYVPGLLRLLGLS